MVSVFLFQRPRCRAGARKHKLGGIHNSEGSSPGVGLMVLNYGCDVYLLIDV